MAKRKQDLAARQQRMRQRRAMGWRGTGRPPKFVDPRQVSELAGEGATDQEIAAVLAVTVETVRAHFAAQLVAARARFTVLLRAALVALALSGHAPALKFVSELFLPEEFAPRRPCLKPRSPEREQRRMMRFLGRARTAAALGKLRNPGAPRRMMDFVASRRARRKQTFVSGFGEGSIFDKVSPAWFGPDRYDELLAGKDEPCPLEFSDPGLPEVGELDFRALEGLPGSLEPVLEPYLPDLPSSSGALLDFPQGQGFAPCGLEVGALLALIATILEEPTG